MSVSPRTSMRTPSERSDASVGLVDSITRVPTWAPLAASASADSSRTGPETVGAGAGAGAMDGGATSTARLGAASADALESTDYWGPVAAIGCGATVSGAPPPPAPPSPLYTGATDG